MKSLEIPGSGINIITSPLKSEVMVSSLSGEHGSWEQYIGVRVIEPETTDENLSKTIIVPVMWSEQSDREFHATRLRTLAQETGARVISVDMPGIGDASTGLTQTQLEALKQGDFSELGKAAWESIINTLSPATPQEMMEFYRYSNLLRQDEEDQFETHNTYTMSLVKELEDLDNARRARGLEKLQNVTILGYSMGASTGAGMLENIPDSVNVDKFIMWESVSGRRNFAKLALGFMASGLTMGKFFKHNLVENGLTKQQNAVPNAFKLAWQVFKQRQSHITAAKAMAKGRAFAGLDPDSKIDYEVIYGSKSLVSSDSTNGEIAKLLGVKPTVLQDHTHSSIEAIRFFAHEARQHIKP